MIKIENIADTYSCHPFTVQEVHFEFKGNRPPQAYHRLKCPDWVNVLPVTHDGFAILIRQPRIGSEEIVLETPGGVVETTEKDVTMSALRELEEETGYSTQRIIPLANLNPNPAIMTNRCHFFLALNCVIPSQRQFFPDASEWIEIEKVPIDRLDDLVRLGRIDHSLSALCILLSKKYLVL